MRKFIVLMLVVTFGLFYSCAKNAENNDTAKNAQEEVIFSMQTLLLIPDSLRSEEDSILLHRIEAVIYEYCVEKDGRLEITVSKKEWKKMGLREEYYEMFAKDVKDINNFLNENPSSEQLILEAYRKAQKEVLNKYSQKN